jgi:hypothetical protein
MFCTLLNNGMPAATTASTSRRPQHMWRDLARTFATLASHLARSGIVPDRRHNTTTTKRGIEASRLMRDYLLASGMIIEARSIRSTRSHHAKGSWPSIQAGVGWKRRGREAQSARHDSCEGARCVRINAGFEERELRRWRASPTKGGDDSGQADLAHRLAMRCAR